MNLICEQGFNKENIAWLGNKFLNGNGYMGIRGTLEEYTKEQMCAVNLAGVYDRVGDAWRESVNAPNPIHTYIKVNGKKLALPDCVPEFHEQSLDIFSGMHMRKTKWATDDGAVTVKAERFASMKRRHIIATKYSVITDFECEIEIVSGIDGDVWDINGPHLENYSVSEKNGIKTVLAKTCEKKISVTVSDYIASDFEKSVSYKNNEKSIYSIIRYKAKPEAEYTVKKIASVTTSVDQILFCDDIEKLSYDELKTEHISAWSKIWDISKIELEGDQEGEMALNYSIYHLACIGPKGFKNISIPARGLSGQTYKGAVFWDTEMFMMDYYIHTDPDVAKTLIRYRIDTLKGAKDKAAMYGLEGAYYPWESQEGGYEACSDYNVVDVFTKRPMRTHFKDKQYHISAAVVYGIIKYIDATGDNGILGDGAMEVIIECAKMYRSLLLKYADKDYYEIHDVVGPDEYHERVNNNVYTNRMAKMVFETAVNTIDTVKDENPECFNKLSEKYDLPKLREVFKNSADEIYIKAPDENGVIEQFDGYFKLEDTTVDTVRSRLLNEREYWGGAYGVASGTQILKQADIVAMLSIFNNDYSKDIMLKNFEYYEPRTEHGSSLSACMYALLACYTGNPNTAYPLFLKSAKADLNSGGKQWAGEIYIGGTHPASEGGAWIVAVRGFAGISVENGEIVCKPSLPDKIKKMRFKLYFKENIYNVEVGHNGYSIDKL